MEFERKVVAKQASLLPARSAVLESFADFLNRVQSAALKERHEPTV
jgi:hypothetical protein